MRLTGVMAAGLLVSIGAARAEEAAATYDLAKPSPWMVGETVTERDESTLRHQMSARRGDRPAQLVSSSSGSTTSTLVRRCDGVAGDGAATAQRIHVAEWEKESGGETDRSLAGATIDATAGSWHFVRPDLSLSRDARSWLTGDLVSPMSGMEARFLALLPSGSVAVGAAWNPDPATLFAHVVRVGATPDMDGARVECRLDRVEDGTAHIVFEATTPIASVGGEGPAEGSECRLSGRASFVPGRWRNTLALESTETFVLAREVDGTRVEIHIASTSDRRHTSGGVIPEAPGRPEGTVAHRLRRAPSRVGDVVTEEAFESFSISGRLATCGAGQFPDGETTAEWTAVRKCLEVSAEGAPVRELVYLREWSRDLGGEPDRSIQGGFYTVTAEGWAPMTPGPEPSPGALRWLRDRPLRARVELAFSSAICPEAPVAVGESWFPELTPLMGHALWGKGLDADWRHATERFRLDDVADDEGLTTALSFEAEVPLSGAVQGDGSEIPAMAGSALRLVGTVSAPGAHWGRLGYASAEFKVDLVTRRGGVFTELHTTLGTGRSVTPGGEMPDPPR